MRQPVGRLACEDGRHTERHGKDRQPRCRTKHAHRRHRQGLRKVGGFMWQLVVILGCRVLGIDLVASPSTIMTKKLSPEARLSVPFTRTHLPQEPGNWSAFIAPACVMSREGGRRTTDVGHLVCQDWCVLMRMQSVCPLCATTHGGGCTGLPCSHHTCAPTEDLQTDSQDGIKGHVRAQGENGGGTGAHIEEMGGPIKIGFATVASCSAGRQACIGAVRLVGSQNEAHPACQSRRH